jgi:ABC-type branched-subunit amino acid transport system ATPase component
MIGAVLEAEGLHTFYAKSHILRRVALTVREGEIVALLGRNGAGKTTTLRSLVGLTPARSGSVRISALPRLILRYPPQLWSARQMNPAAASAMPRPKWELLRLSFGWVR